MNSDIFTAVDGRHGRFYVLRNDTYVSRSMIEYGEWCESEVGIMSAVLRPGDIAIDVGANIGTLSVPLATRLGPRGLLYCFEPQPGIFQLLAANLTVNGLGNVRLFNAACAETPEKTPVAEMNFRASINYGALGLKELRDVSELAEGKIPVRNVPVVRIDDVFTHPRLRLIKIDVEGAELAVLRGAEATIRRCKPLLYIENETAQNSPALVAAVFDLGYRAYWHASHMFNAGNFRGNATNVFGTTGCINMVCVHRDVPSTISGLLEVLSVDDYPTRHAAVPAADA